MRRQRRQDQRELARHIPRQRLPPARRVGELHERGDGGIEPQALDVLGDLGDGPVQCPGLLVAGFAIPNRVLQAAAVA